MTGGLDQILWQAADMLEQCRRTAALELKGDATNRVLVLKELLACQFRTSSVRLPRSVVALYPRQLERILRALQDLGTPVDLDADSWRKNRLILSGRLIPVGAEFADPLSGIPQRTLLLAGARQALDLVTTLSLRTRGFRPCLELHSHPDSLDDFNAAGWEQTYVRLAELLQQNQQFKAVIASSWFRDPALAAISPRLSYLRDFPCRHGARLYATSKDTSGLSGALTTSATRRRLFASGRYVPTIHMMIWPRSALLRWYVQRETLQQG